MAEVRAIAARLVRWHERHGRHDLPWQRERSPYRVWVSEIMLQQTQVTTVLGYYERFLRRFSDVQALAAAPIDEVLHLWSGLGYYSRARNLHRTAQRVVAEHDGVFPVDPEVLATLPGIGRSTAAAIAALAHGRRAAILDGNARRVLSRFFGIEGRRGARATERELWRRAEACTPTSEVAAYTQAIMDLGATLCVRRQPRCTDCPLVEDCVARLTGRVHELPRSRARPARTERTVVMLIAQRSDGSVLLRRRAPRGVWASLWAPPEFESREAAARFCATELCDAALEETPLPLARQAFTHFDLTIVPLHARCTGKHAIQRVMEGEGTLWYNAHEPARIGLPAAVATLLSSLEKP